jgi:enoyl-CoA hydratase/carnithine racemase
VFVMAYSNIGLSPDGGGSWSLSRALPRQLVTELLMCGNKLDAPRLHTLGLINRLVTQGTVLTEALALADVLNARAPNALASCKELVNEAADNTLPEHLKLERDNFVANLRHNNAGIGIEAFLSKKTPKYE